MTTTDVLPGPAGTRSLVRTFEAFGARGEVLNELLAYSEDPRAALRPLPAELPLPDEPHVATWEGYADEARADGVLAALRRRLVQFRFPVAAGMSVDPDYVTATRRGLWPPGHAAGLILEKPDAIDLTLHPSAAGRIPTLVVGHRGDFEVLVCALARRNERQTIPASMGACIVTGLNNWDRVARHRLRFEAQLGAPASEEEWSDELRRLSAHPNLYQDRLLLLSRGPYSAVPAAAAGLSQRDWLDTSLTIRREHECFHLLTCRVFGSMRNNALDELLADFVGLLRAFGRYDDELARRFLGLDGAAPRFVGRLANYRGIPPLSDAAFSILSELVVHCTRSLARQAERHTPGLADPLALARLSLQLYARGLSGIAESEPTPCRSHEAATRPDANA